MNVFDVAKYILHELGAIQVWKLHKLIYYCQAWSLVWDDEPLFEENFYAWDNGPLCRPWLGTDRAQRMYIRILDIDKPVFP